MAPNEAFLSLIHRQISWLNWDIWAVCAALHLFHPHLGSLFLSILIIVIIICVGILIRYFHSRFQDTYQVLLTPLWALERRTAWRKHTHKHSNKLNKSKLNNWSQNPTQNIQEVTRRHRQIIQVDRSACAVSFDGVLVLLFGEKRKKKKSWMVLT